MLHIKNQLLYLHHCCINENYEMLKLLRITIFLIFPLAINAVYSLSIANGTVKKEFDLSSGACNGFTKFN